MQSTESPSTFKDDTRGDGTSETIEQEEEDTDAFQAKELARLHKMGIPVPGVEIKFDKHVAKVWLENLEIECSSKIIEHRVRAVVERAVEVTAPLWGS